MNVLKTLGVAAVGMSLGALAQAQAQAQTEALAPEWVAAAHHVAVTTCANCHGPRGHSTAPKFPVLAGQKANYLAAQMQAFKAQTRGDADAIGYMWGMAQPLTDDMITALADYYSHQAPGAADGGKPADLARGREIFQNGDPGKGIPACATCHGAGAEGTDQFPRLAGQHAQYVLKQLRSFQNNMRNMAIMHGVAQQLEETDMRAVADYLQSLGS